ncbi:hypothetical protein F5144DRAFT_575349 [Chaetomium tenue]|uniref:Uncharacterized protein n=1 Tax=Chaetomium tenue TaxID=1854479 RepID=A0ACB7PBM1_9PEZI|nr:hypothetical protein F5144DRAFT_575349 [Chaetomium globosum]
MKWLSSSPAFALSATLIGVTMIPLATFWGFNLCGKHGRDQAQPLRLTRIFLHMAFPIYLLAIATAIISPVTAIVRLKDTDVRMVDLNWQAGWIGFWGWAVSSLLATAASVLASHAIYLAGLSVWYLVLAKQKWWKAVQLDTIIATVLLIVLDIAWFGKTIADAFDINADRIRLEWLLVVIDLTLCLVAALNVGIAIYCATKLKRRGDLVTGNLSGLFLAASLLWLLRCAFVLAVDLKTVIPDWTRDESDAQKIINPILDYWVSATVLGLVTFMVRNRVWSDPSVFADKGHWQQQQMYVQPVSQYPQPQYGQQQQPEVRRKAHQDYEQQ